MDVGRSKVLPLPLSEVFFEIPDPSEKRKQHQDFALFQLSTTPLLGGSQAGTPGGMIGSAPGGMTGGGMTGGMTGNLIGGNEAIATQEPPRKTLMRRMDSLASPPGTPRSGSRSEGGVVVVVPPPTVQEEGPPAPLRRSLRMLYTCACTGLHVICRRCVREEGQKMSGGREINQERASGRGRRASGRGGSKGVEVFT